MASISICGNIGRDPELKAAGTSQVLTFSVADSEYIYVKNGEAESQWYNVEVWGKSAERLSSWLSKGTKVFVSGQLAQRSYEGKNGKGKALEIKDARVTTVSKKGEEGGGSASAADDLFGSAPF